MNSRFLVFFLVLSGFAHAGMIKTIDFLTTAGTSEISIASDDEIVFESFENQEDKQLIIDIRNATLGPMAKRFLDTSSFDSPVALISPYNVAETGGVRVVIQMRDQVRSEVVSNGNRLVINVNQGLVSDASVQVEAAQTEATPQDALSTFEESQNTERFSGSPITIQVRDADIRDVLRLIGEASGFNIVTGGGVQGKITLSLINVPWDQALDVILDTMKLGAERNENILRVQTLSNLTSQKQAELAAKQAARAAAPRVTRIFPISYADPPQLVAILKKFGSSGRQGDATGSIEVDNRTNSVVIQDVNDNIERMQKLIEILDTQTPQVLIEGKVVEASETFANSIRGQIGFANLENQSPQIVSFNGMSFPDFSDPVARTGFVDNLSLNSNDAGAGFYSPMLGISDAVRANAVLFMGESEALLKTVSSPKTVVLNKESANITQKIPVIVDIPQQSEQGSIIGTKVVEEAVISLEVRPTVTNDESVLMELALKRDIPFQTSGTTAVAEREMKTKVLVASGSTLVIGGVYIADDTSSDAGFPILKDIPIIGWFFSTKNKSKARSELYMFITPKILNIKEAGLAGA